MNGKVIEVVTVQPREYKVIVTKLYRPSSIQIQNYAELDQDKMEMRL